MIEVGHTGLTNTYVVVEPAGRRRAVPADADGWSDSDDICPAHVALIRLSSAGLPPAEPCAGDPITRPVVD